MNKATTAGALLAGVALVALVLSLLSSDLNEPAGQAVEQPTAVTTGPATSASTLLPTTTVPPSALRVCTVEDLNAGVAGTRVVSGSQTTTIVLTNLSPSPCGLILDMAASATEVTVTGDLRVENTDVDVPGDLAGSSAFPFEPGLGQSESVRLGFYSASPGPEPGRYTYTSELRLDLGAGGTLHIGLPHGAVGAATSWIAPPDFRPEIGAPIPPADVPLCTPATIRADILRGDSLMGTRYRPLVLTNVGSQPCGLPLDITLTAHGTESVGLVDRVGPTANHYTDPVIDPGEQVRMTIVGSGGRVEEVPPTDEIERFVFAFPDGTTLPPIEVGDTSWRHYGGSRWFGPISATADDGRYFTITPSTIDAGNPLGDGTEMGADHIGAMRVNMTPEQVADALGQAIHFHKVDDDCWSGTVGPGDVSVTFEWSEIGEVFVSTGFGSKHPGIRSRPGIGVGSSFAEFAAAYPDAGKIADPHLSDEAWDAGPAQGSDHLVFGFRDGVVARIAAGKVATDVARCN